MKKRILFFFLLLLIFGNVYIHPLMSRETASIQGDVRDKSTGLALWNVNVSVVGTKFGAASDINGTFRIEHIPDGQYTLRFSAIGYKPVMTESVLVRTGELISLHIRLEPTVIHMDRIVVTATRGPKLLAETPELMMVQTAADIRAIGAGQIHDIIEYLPGISTNAGTGSGQPFKRTVSINGMPAYYSLVLIDGKRVLSSHMHTGADVNVIPPEHIERIETLKGAASAQYGTDGMGGVINIITRKGSENGEISLSSYGGSNRTFHNGLSVTGAIGRRVYHSLFSSWDQSEGLPILEPAHRKDKLGYSMFQLMDRIDADLTGNLKASASLHYINTEAPYRQNPLSSYLLTPAFELHYDISPNASLQTSGYYSVWKSQQNNELNEIASPVVFFNYDGLKNNQLLMGAEWIYRNFARVRVAEHDQHALGLFLQDEITIGTAWRLLAAIRLDHVQHIKPVVSPKLSVLHRWKNNLSFRTSIGRGFRAPTVQDLHETLYSHPGNIHYRAGNPDLQPEYSTTVTTGMEWEVSDKLSLILNGYYYAIDQMITPVDHGLEDPYIYFSPEQIPFVTDSLVYIYRRENIHRGMIGGGEFKMLWYFAPGFSFEGGFSISHNENKDTGESLPYYPGKSLSMKLIGHRSIASGFSVGGFIGLNAAMDRKIWKFKHDAEQQVNLNDYQKLDAGLSCIFSNRYELFFNVDNLLAQELNLYEDVNFVTQGTPLFRLGIRLTGQ